MRFVIERVVTPIKVFNSLLGTAIKGNPLEEAETTLLSSLQ